LIFIRQRTTDHGQVTGKLYHLNDLLKQSQKRRTKFMPTKNEMNELMNMYIEQENIAESGFKAPKINQSIIRSFKKIFDISELLIMTYILTN
jgi:uncharacterized protein YpmS